VVFRDQGSTEVHRGCDDDAIGRISDLIALQQAGGSGNGERQVDDVGVRPLDTFLSQSVTGRLNVMRLLRASVATSRKGDRRDRYQLSVQSIQSGT
jgi:hypothetical protein